MTSGPVKGNNLLLYLGVDALSCVKNCSYDLQRKTIDATCKDLDGAEQSLVAGYGGTMTADGIWKFDANFGINDLMTAFLAGNTLTAKWSTEVAGDSRLVGSVLITGIGASSNFNDVGAWNISLKLTGTVIWETI